MSRSPILLASSALLWLGLCTPVQAAHLQAPTLATLPTTEDDETSDEHGEAATTSVLGPHDRAPGQLDDLFIDSGTWIRTWGEDWFEAQAEAGESRFSESDEAAEITEDGDGIGEFEAGWVDSEGEYEFRYDEEEDEFAYWQFISAELLTRGRQDFVQFCASCHGFNGNGYGRSAQFLRPPPRNFQQSTFKFTKVIGEYLPSDAALAALVHRGLDGTPMLPWALSDVQLHEILQYIKSLSPEGEGWRDVYSEIGDVVEIGADPYANDSATGIAEGRKIYHRIGCYNCHPGYDTPGDINTMLGKDAGITYRSDLTYPKSTTSSIYAVMGHKVKILPPDFTFNTMRSGANVEEVALTIAAGIGGAGMPQWKGGITDEEIWAVGHYIRDLVDRYKDQPAERAAFMARLRSGN
ncbi:MAG: mono/diheme cytochrome c family protein [Pseudohongiellaceae bacterium]|jgi:mono/diheme cytochrome c family protein